MACGTPVLTSSVSATAGVSRATRRCSSTRSRSDAIRDGLRQLLVDSDLRAEYARRGIERAAQFSWARAADETRAVYHRVVSGGRPA